MKIFGKSIAKSRNKIARVIIKHSPGIWLLTPQKAEKMRRKLDHVIMKKFFSRWERIMYRFKAIRAAKLLLN